MSSTEANKFLKNELIKTKAELTNMINYLTTIEKQTFTQEIHKKIESPEITYQIEQLTKAITELNTTIKELITKYKNSK